jgi:hypothetical protein
LIGIEGSTLNAGDLLFRLIFTVWRKFTGWRFPVILPFQVNGKESDPEIFVSFYVGDKLLF